MFQSFKKYYVLLWYSNWLLSIFIFFQKNKILLFKKYISNNHIDYLVKYTS